MRGFSRFLTMLLFLGFTLPLAAAEARPKVSGAWVRLPVIAGRPGAAYFRLESGVADQLLEVSSPQAQSAMLHNSSMEGGVMRMDELPGMAVPAGQPVLLAPGGAHVMLFGLAPSVKPGSTVTLLLHFAKAGQVAVQAKAQAATAPPPVR